MDRRALRGLERPAGQRSHRHRRPRRPRGGQPDLPDRGPGVLGHLADRGELAHPPLAGPHGHRRVALQQLQRVEALVDREADVVGGHVLAEAGEALPVRPAPRRTRPPGPARRRRSPARRAPRARPRSRARVALVPEPERERGLGAGDRARGSRRARCDPWPATAPAAWMPGGAVLGEVGAARPRPSGPWPRPGAAARSPGRVPPETATRSQSMPRSVSAIAAARLVERRPTTAPFTCRRPSARTTAVPRSSRIPAAVDPRRELLRRRRRGARRRRAATATPASLKRQRRLEAAVGGGRDDARSSRAAPRRGRRAAARPSTASPREGRCPRTSAAARSSRSRRRGGRRGPGAGCCPHQTGTIPSKNPSAAAGASTSTPAARTRAADLPRATGAVAREQGAAELRARRRPAPRRPPARRRAAPPPCRRRRRRSPARRRGGGGTRCATRARAGGERSLPSPAALRSTFS